MKKINFATRITVATVAKSDGSNAHNSERLKVQASVNAHPFIIDRTVFQKTDQEKSKLATAKSAWKRLQK